MILPQFYCLAENGAPSGYFMRYSLSLLKTSSVKLWKTSAKVVLMSTLSRTLNVTENMNRMMNFKVLRLFEFFSRARNYKRMRRQEGLL